MHMSGLFASPEPVVFAGLLAQTTSALLLAVLFAALLRRYGRRRVYFGLWGWAWVALALALAALDLRFRVVAADGVAASALHFVYQLGKVSWIVLLAAGVMRLTRGLPSRRTVGICLVAGALYAAVSAGLGEGGLRSLALWQAPLMIVAGLGSAGALLALPRGRRTAGTSMTALVFGAVALLWAAYLGVYLRSGGAAVAPGNAYRVLAVYNLVLEVLSGLGMVLILMEEGQRDLDDAWQQLETAYGDLQRRSLHDALTGCLNRRALEERAGLEHLAAEFGAVVMLDLDNLKLVNDALGHGAGDRLLQHLVGVLRQGIRPGDRIYRWGGDEFVLLMRRGRVAQLHGRLRRIIAAAPPLTLGGVAVELAVSAGCADFAAGEQIDAAIAAADRAMYEEKRRRKMGPSPLPLQDVTDPPPCRVSR
jgi:diguanylate cyclase (GGDEF)-like protein